MEFYLRRLKIIRKIKSWWFGFQIKHFGTFIPKDYPTIQDALDAGKKLIIIQPKKNE